MFSKKIAGNILVRKEGLLSKRWTKRILWAVLEKSLKEGPDPYHDHSYHEIIAVTMITINQINSQNWICVCV